MAVSNTDDLGKADILSLDYNGKVRMLEGIAQRLLDTQIEYSKVAGRNAELRAEIEVLKQVKSALQSAIRAEGN